MMKKFAIGLLATILVALGALGAVSATNHPDSPTAGWSTPDPVV